MPYLRPIKRTVKKFYYKNYVIFFVVVFLIIVGILNPDFIISRLQKTALLIGGTNLGFIEAVSTKMAWFQSKEELKKDNDSLKEKIDELLMDNYAMEDSLLAEIEELQLALGRQNEPNEPDSIESFVLGKPPFVSYNSLILDVGENYGIEKGDLAVKNGFAIGEISEIREKESVLKIFGTDDDEIEVMLGDKKLNVMAEGKGAGFFTVRVSDEEGDFLGQAVRFQKNPDYLIGRVVFSRKSPGGRYQELEIMSPVNILEISSVKILSGIEY